MSEDKKHSYIKFYCRDWLGDAMLRMCTPDERGVWIDMLCVMAGAEPYGHLAVNGRAMSDVEVSRVIGLDETTYKGILYRLLEKGIPSQAENGMIYSRRMIREHNLFLSGSKYGKKGGGNPALRKKHKKNPDTISHNPNTKATIKDTFIGLLNEGFASKDLDSDAFIAALESWNTHRIELKKPLKPQSFKSQIKFFSKIGHDRAIEAIEHSIKNGWQGLFEPSQPKTTTSNTMPNCI
jgi:hypothetical protein